MKIISVKLIYGPSKQFDKELNKIKENDPPIHKRIKNKIDYLLNNPESYDRVLKGDKRCKLEKYVGRGLIRIVYNWCENCRRCNCNIVNKCIDCENKPDNTLILFDVYYKNEARKRGY